MKQLLIFVLICSEALLGAGHQEQFRCMLQYNIRRWIFTCSTIVWFGHFLILFLSLTWIMLHISFTSKHFLYYNSFVLHACWYISLRSSHSTYIFFQKKKKNLFYTFSIDNFFYKKYIIILYNKHTQIFKVCIQFCRFNV